LHFIVAIYQIACYSANTARTEWPTVQVTGVIEMTAERNTAYMSAIVDMWAPLLDMGLITIEEFNQKIVDGVEYLKQPIQKVLEDQSWQSI